MRTFSPSLFLIFSVSVAKFFERRDSHFFRYRSSATPRDFEIYAPNASFEDPLTSAHGYVLLDSILDDELVDLGFIIVYLIRRAALSLDYAE